MPADAAGRLEVSVAFSPRPGQVDEIVLTLVAGSTLRDAIDASGLRERHPDWDLQAMAVGIWGVLAEPGRVLRERDRVEVYRPLTVDPKEARRLRYRESPGSAKPKPQAKPQAKPQVKPER